MKKLLFVVAIALTLSNGNTVNAQTGASGWRTITAFGCHLTDGTCYFHIDGDAVGPEGCKNNSVRFNVLKSPNGKTWLSMIEMAYIAKRKVNLRILETCYVDQPAYPTFSYGSISSS